MKFSLRGKFMLWIMALIAVIYLGFGAALYAFNHYERKMHPWEAEEEWEELIILYSLMACILPVAILVAWRVTDKALEPLRSMLRTARRIQQGGLDQRIEIPAANDELAQLAGTLNEAFDNYQRVLERIDRFSLDAAHQLRNPLTAMRASGEVCLQKERSVGEYQEVIGGLVEDSRRLGHTVDQLLLLARLTRKDLAEVFEPLDLSPVVVDLVDSLRPAFEASDVRLELRVETGPYRIQGSPRLIEQAVANLLDNALRFTPAQGVVQVSLEKPAPGRILLSVADSGPGLSPLAAPGGTKGDSRSTTIRSKEGAGLGLLIVSNVVSAHGGTVQAKVSQWGGACFSLDLPASE